ncbi:MAG: hypothetical protein Fur0010_02240 [Bdellovibrio sp.]
METKCYRCGTVLALELNSKVSRQEECPKCFSSIHCRKMCSFYEPKSYNECKEPVAQRIVDKEKNNFCEFFKLSSGPTKDFDQEKIFSAAEALFKK